MFDEKAKRDAAQREELLQTCDKLNVEGNLDKLSNKGLRVLIGERKKVLYEEKLRQENEKYHELVQEASELGLNYTHIYYTTVHSEGLESIRNSCKDLQKKIHERKQQIYQQKQRERLVSQAEKLGLSVGADDDVSSLREAVRQKREENQREYEARQLEKWQRQMEWQKRQAEKVRKQKEWKDSGGPERQARYLHALSR